MKNFNIPSEETEITFVRSSGSGGQNVNKVSTAVQLRFDIMASSLPDVYKKRLLGLATSRITKDGIIIIKSQKFRTQEKNRAEAFRILNLMIRSVFLEKKKRKPTKATPASKKKKMKDKIHRGRIKADRSNTGKNNNGE